MLATRTRRPLATVGVGTAARVTLHGVVCTDVVGRAADRAPASDAVHARDLDSSSAGNSGCRDHRALHASPRGVHGRRGSSS